MQAKKMLLLLAAACFVFIQFSKAQLNVVFKDNTAFIAVKVDTAKATKRKINIDKLPDSIVLTFPDDDPKNFLMQFNKDSLKFFVGFGCDGDTCIKLLLRDVKEGKIVLYFLENKLSGISDRRFDKPREVLSKKGENILFIAIKSNIKAPEKKDKGSLYFGSIPQRAVEVTESKKGEDDTINFFCSNVVCKDCYKPCDPKKKDSCVRNFLKCENEYDLFNKVFEKNHQFHNGLSSDKVTPKYWIVYDNREGKSIIPYYFKIHNNRGKSNFLQLKTSISPKARKHAVFTVLGPKDSAYTIDEVALQYYEEQEPKMSEVLQGIKPTPSEAATTGGETPEAEKSKETDKRFDNLGPESTLTQYQNQLAVAYKLKKGDNNRYELMYTESRKDSASGEELLDNYISALERIIALTQQNQDLNNSLKRLKKANAALKKLADSLSKEIVKREVEIKSLKDSLVEANKKIKKLEDQLKGLPKTKDIYKKMMTLESDLKKFNTQYEDISYVEKQYLTDRLCLQLKIEAILGVTSVQSSAELSSALTDKIITEKIDTMYFRVFKRLIKDIEYNYGILMSKKAKSSIFSSSKKTPNTDEFVTTLKTKNVITPFYTDTFKTSWGLKIDFSTGIFINGLSNNEFGTTPHTFRYRETKDTVVVRGGVGIDSVMYTGQIKNTTGNLISSNNPKMSYSAGFLVHVYPRTGTFVNAGMVTGVTINNSNSSPIQLMLGGCLMFNAGKSSRVSIVGGCTWGQVKELSEATSPYQLNRDSDPDNRLYNSINDVPRFYSGSSELLTYNKWKKSWFFGITYNFASLNIGK